VTAIAYLGPPGTFTEQAASSLRTLDDVRLEPLHSVPEVLESVERNVHQYGVVPIENSVEGEVTSTLDHLIFRSSSILIREEIILPVTFSVFRRSEFTDQEIRKVISHRTALAQCRRFVGDLEQLSANSTADACDQVAHSEDPHLAAIASPTAGPRYGLAQVAERIEDYIGAHTRFFVVGTTLFPPGPLSMKTTLVITTPDDRIGILSQCLGFFSERNVNILSIYSRPLRSNLGSYCFVATVAGHLSDGSIRDANHELMEIGAAVKPLGSYAAWVGEEVALQFDNRPPGSVDISSPPETMRRLFPD
jgi:prephenate dehydratase